MSGTMLKEQVSTLSVEVRQAIVSFAAAMAETLQFQAYEQAHEHLQGDSVAQEAIRALQTKQQSLEVMFRLNAVSQEERDELQRLQQNCMAQPSVIAYGRAQAELAGVCTALATVVSREIGLDYAGACGVGCGCGPSGAGQGSPERWPDIEVSEALAVAGTLGSVLQQAEPIKGYLDARARLEADPVASGLLRDFAQALGNLRNEEANGSVSALSVERARSLQRQMQRDPTIADYAHRQQAAIGYVQSVNGEISGLLGFDLASLSGSGSC
jgi:cell fate (sporulation/competence/biofilm development) regulator YlbF (YheA/YmcA/DUF963 family)